MTGHIKSRLRERFKMTKKHYKYSKMKSYVDELQEKTDKYTALILKEKYVRCMSNKLNNPLMGPKSYWSIMNDSLNDRKIPAMSSLLVNGNSFTSFSKKADLFNKFFADQCTPHNNLNLKYVTSSLP